jgi:hypothetical protein
MMTGATIGKMINDAMINDAMINDTNAH